MGLLVGLGVAVETAMTLGMFITVALVVGMGVKRFFFED